MDVIEAKKILERFGLEKLNKMEMLVMLEQLKAECDTYLEYGNRRTMCLWAKDADGQIECMHALLGSLPE